MKDILQWLVSSIRAFDIQLEGSVLWEQPASVERWVKESIHIFAAWRNRTFILSPVAIGP